MRRTENYSCVCDLQYFSMRTFFSIYVSLFPIEQNRTRSNYQNIQQQFCVYVLQIKCLNFNITRMKNKPVIQAKSQLLNVDLQLFSVMLVRKNNYSVTDITLIKSYRFFIRRQNNISLVLNIRYKGNKFHAIENVSFFYNKAADGYVCVAGWNIYYRRCWKDDVRMIKIVSK